MFNELYPSDPDRVKPFVYEDAGTLSLHFDISAIQSRMRRDDHAGDTGHLAHAGRCRLEWRSETQSPVWR